MNKSRTKLRAILEHVSPLDERERRDVCSALAWVDSTDDLYRRQEPDVPPKHLVSYFVVTDPRRRTLLLLDHVKAGLWLPPGGHVEPGEEPHEAVRREMTEELGSRAAMVATIADLPLFVTETQTRGAGSHTDVSLWYVVAGDEKMWIELEPGSFRGSRWQSYQGVLDTDISELDPEMHRFVHKLQGRV